MNYLFLVTIFLLNAQCTDAFYLPYEQPKYTIMLDPAGDAHHTGRIIDDTFERTITLRFAQELAQQLKKHEQVSFHALLSRTPGQLRDQLQTATMANRLSVNAYIHIACYQSKTVRPTLNIFYMSLNPVTDSWKKHSPTSFVPYHEAYCSSQSITKKLAQLLYDFALKQKIDVYEPLGIPAKPLLGITTPAVMIELGLKSADDWHLFLEPCAQAIKQFIIESAQHE